MLIKDLAEQAGVSVKAVRYYESRGLITPDRAPNGYREYDAADVLVVREIRALLSLGLTADETVPFVECIRAGNDRADVCPASLDAYRLRIAEIDQRIEELSRLRGELSGLLHDAETYRPGTYRPEADRPETDRPETDRPETEEKP
ncbi:MAG TPA: MerR family transcriptional regulator [Nocardioides sp.]|nr:MerR family transcriptional regulator [Nocardioides sp.]